ncbi:MAG: glycosyltransferase family 4 protein [Firmicutes bacterium]|nr:glycosyltransferase family 4 protein [Bacillota bacterium]
MKTMRFLFLTQYYPPEPGAASLRLRAMAHQLMRHGHQVEVVTAFPHHLGAQRTRRHRGRLFFSEVVEGVPVIRTWIWIVPSGRLWRRLLNYFSFVVTSFWGLWRARRPDYIIVESPPLFLGITAYIYGKIRRVPYILSVSDLWPESAVALGLVKNRHIIRWSQKLEFFLYRHARYVSGVTEGICRSVEETQMIDPRRVLFFPNGVDTEVFRPLEPSRELAEHLGVQEKHVFMYPGTMGYAQGLEVILDAAEMLRDRPEIVFLLVGEGPVKPSLMALAEGRGLSNVRFEELQPFERMSLYFSLARGVVVPLRRHKLFAGARPSKVFPAWAAKVPIIFVGEGEMARLVEEAGGGLVVPPEDAAGLAMAVDFLSRISDYEWTEMAQSGHNYVLQHYTWDIIADRWLKGIESGG